MMDKQQTIIVNIEGETHTFCSAEGSVNYIDPEGEMFPIEFVAEFDEDEEGIYNMCIEAGESAAVADKRTQLYYTAPYLEVSEAPWVQLMDEVVIHLLGLREGLPKKDLSLQIGPGKLKGPSGVDLSLPTTYLELRLFKASETYRRAIV
jgi:hypothetical protein